MHHWEGLKFGRRDWKKKLWKYFFMKSLSPSLLPVCGNFLLLPLKNLSLAFFVYAFQKYRAKEEKPGCVHQTNVKKCSSGTTFIWVKGSSDQTAQLPPSCCFKIFLFYASCRTQSNSATGCPLSFISYSSKRACGHSSAGTQLFPAQHEPATLPAYMLSECVIC